MARYNLNCLYIIIIDSLRIFIVIIFSRRCIINDTQVKIIILKGVIYKLDKVISELPGDEGVVVLVLLPHGSIEDVHPSSIPSFLPLNIVRVDGTDDTIIFILELEAPIIIQEL